MHVGFFVLFSLWGFLSEYLFGHLWSVIGTSPWIYPNSLLRFTSWKVAPLWGLAGLTIIQLIKAIMERDKKALVCIGLLQALIVFYITILSIVS